MKRLTAIFLCAILLFTLSACAGGKTEKESSLIECETGYVSLHCATSYPEQPEIKVISAKAEFDACYNEIDENYDNLEWELKPLFEKYTDEFFENKAIIQVVFDVGSSSEKYSENLVKGRDGKLYVNIKNTTLYGSVVNDDIQVWFAFIEIEKQNLPKSPDDIVMVTNHFADKEENEKDNGSRLGFKTERFYCVDMSQELPVLKIVKSVEELEECSVELKITYNGAGESIDFEEACSKYTKDFFKHKSLIIVTFDYDINEKRFDVDSIIEGADGKLYVSRIHTQKHDPVEADKTVRGVFIELDKHNLPKNIEDIVLV